MRAWDVYLDGKVVDTVYFDAKCDEFYVKTSLINHDGLPYTITVKEAK